MRVATRQFEVEDLDAIASIEAAISPDPWSRSLFAGELDLPPASRYWLVAEAGTHLVGYGGIMFATDIAHVLNLGVHTDWLRRHLAQRLCCELAMAARELGATALTLEVRASNEAAVGLYRKLGMVESGLRPRYYPDNEDALIYWLHDLDQDDVGGRLRQLLDESLAADQS